jgi:hypothetical protein
MRAVVEVVFESDDIEQPEWGVLSNLGRWVGAEIDDEKDPVHRGGRLARVGLAQRNHAYNHRMLSDILAWIDASRAVFEERLAEGSRMTEAVSPETPQEGAGVRLIDNPAVLGILLVEAAEDALRDLATARPLIVEALTIATPSPVDRKLVGA